MPGFATLAGRVSAMALLGLMAGFSATLLGCEEGAQPGAFGTATNALECRYNSDCPAQLVCAPLTGRCQECFNEAQGLDLLIPGAVQPVGSCGAGERCSADGLCVAACVNDRDCNVGVCRDGECIEEGADDDDDDDDDGETGDEETAGGDGDTDDEGDSLIEQLRKRLIEAGWLEDTGDLVPPGGGGEDTGFGGIIDDILDQPSSLACDLQEGTSCDRFACAVCLCYGIYDQRCWKASLLEFQNACDICIAIFQCDAIPGVGGGGFDLPVGCE